MKIFRALPYFSFSPLCIASLPLTEIMNLNILRHVFYFRKCGKPLKPKLTAMIASDTGQTKAKVIPISILSVQLRNNIRAQIVYGLAPFLAFESIVSIIKFSIYFTR